jgi:hypothetical protein
MAQSGDESSFTDSITYRTPTSQRVLQEVGWVVLSLMLAAMVTAIVGPFLFPKPGKAEWLFLLEIFLGCVVVFAGLLRVLRNRNLWWSITVTPSHIGLARNARWIDLPCADLELVHVPLDDPSRGGFNRRVWPLILHFGNGKRYQVLLNNAGLFQSWRYLKRSRLLLEAARRTQDSDSNT